MENQKRKTVPRDKLTKQIELNRGKQSVIEENISEHKYLKITSTILFRSRTMEENSVRLIKKIKESLHEARIYPYPNPKLSSGFLHINIIFIENIYRGYMGSRLGGLLGLGLRMRLMTSSSS